MLHVLAIQGLAASLDCGRYDQSIVKGKRMVARKRKRRSVRVGSEMTPPPAIVVSARSRRMSAEKA
ncbi:hypothetical protein ABIB90_001572 [Bradyrhizobium sp. JR4.1]|uniref:hypothetical protein n=1 Tax=Bradyrhizobium TaxID=374 RepID=UPI001FE4FD71|nr:hypothetical protein [Bradyrhizobium canariense]